MTRMSERRLLAWAWWLLAAVALLGWAHVARYTNVEYVGAGARVWDCWLRRECVFTASFTRCFGVDRVWPTAHVRPRQ